MCVCICVCVGGGGGGGGSPPPPIEFSHDQHALHLGPNLICQCDDDDIATVGSLISVVNMHAYMASSAYRSNMSRTSKVLKEWHITLVDRLAMHTMGMNSIKTRTLYSFIYLLLWLNYLQYRFLMMVLKRFTDNMKIHSLFWDEISQFP